MRGYVFESSRPNPPPLRWDVTHDQIEAMTLAGRMAVIHRGTVQR